MTMADIETKKKPALKVEKPRLYKVILMNDDYTPREFVIFVLQAVFKLSEDQASRVMITAHMKGRCVVTVLPRDVAETKAKEATDLAAGEGFPLLFVAEPED
jgi:ATP-dependent Clp protease adaptor protein ClpS